MITQLSEVQVRQRQMISLVKALRKYILITGLFVQGLYPQSFLDNNPFIYNYLIELLKNPHVFFMNFQYEMDNLNPIYGKKYMPIDWRIITERKTDDIFINSWRYRFSLSANITSPVFSMFNYNLKVTGLREDVYIPEIYFGFGHYFYLPIYSGLLGNPYQEMLKETSLQTFSGFVGLSKSLREDIKIYWGYRLAYGYMKLPFPSGLPSFVTTLRDQDVDEKWVLNDIFLGVTYLIPNSNWETMITLAFNPDKLFFGSKLEFVHKYVGLGLGYYPSGILLPFRPFVKLIYEF